MKYGRNGPLTSHLMLANDIFLVVEASTEQAIKIKTILDSFCLHLGQRVNTSKSIKKIFSKNTPQLVEESISMLWVLRALKIIFFSKNTPHLIEESISNIVSIETTKDIKKCLDVLVITSRKDKYSYAFKVNKVRNKLSCWKSNSLSMISQITLTQSCITSLLNYMMKYTIIHMFTFDNVERLCWNFIWGTSTNVKKCHLISWKIFVSRRMIKVLVFVIWEVLT